MNLSSTLRTFALAATAAFVTVGCGANGSTGAADPSNSAGTTGSTGTTGTTAGAGSTTTAGGAAAHSQHKHCGWIGADTFDAGKAAFLANPDYYDAIHPKWGTLQSDGTVKVLQMADDAQIMQTAKAHSIKVIPLIDADDASAIRSSMSSPSRLASHSQMIADLVNQHGWDGVELDYEHLWSAADRAPYTALVKGASDALHAQNKLLTLALPAMDADHKDAAYDYPAIQDSVDVLHLMGYDFHYYGGDHLGPLAPKGWINDVVTRVQSLGHPEKYVLGVANYGISKSWYASAKESAARCGGSYSSQTDHMTTCPIGHQEAGLAPHCTTSQGDVWFEDVASMTEKVALAKAHGLGGVGYWTMGDEPDGFFDAMKQQFPDDAKK